MKKKLIFSAVLALSFLPLLASAQSLPDVWNPASIKGPLVTCTGDVAGIDQNPAGLNPCQSLCDLVRTVVSDIYIGIAFIIWIILPISFIAGGIMYMLGGANPGLLTSAKSTLKGAVIGTIIVLCAYLLIATFVQFMRISNIGGFSSNSPAVCSL
jgi:hypothetical protein